MPIEPAHHAPAMPSARTDRRRLGLAHRAFDRLYPAIRVFHERVRRNTWFSQITPDAAHAVEAELWLGGAPTYPRDYAFLVEHGIRGVIDIRAEREDDVTFYAAHDVAYARFPVPDVHVPDAATITAAVDWIRARVAEGRAVLVHCAKGRSRSSTVLAAYLVAEHGLEPDTALALMKSKRRLTKLERRHLRQIEIWAQARAQGLAVSGVATGQAPES